MKIAFLGNFRVDYSSESHYMKTLRDLGHRVFLLNEGIDEIEQIRKHALESDVFFWVHTHGWFTPGMPELLEELKAKGIPTFGYHLDLWFGIEREKDLETDCYWNLDYFFSVDKLMVDFLNSREDMPKAFFLPAGVFDQECFIGNKVPGLGSDVAFAGGKVNYHKEWQYRIDLINFLEKTYSMDFKLWGRDGLGLVRGSELNDVYANTKVMIGDTLCKNFDYPYYFSDRIFETTGRGGFIIHPNIVGIDDLFRLPVVNVDGTLDTTHAEIVTYDFGNFDQLEYLIDYFVKHDDEREAIRMRGFERTKRDHTYKNRLSFILETLSKELNLPNESTNSVQ